MPRKSANLPLLAAILTLSILLATGCGSSKPKPTTLPSPTTVATATVATATVATATVATATVIDTPSQSPTPQPVYPSATPIPSFIGKVIRVTSTALTGDHFNPLYIHATATCPAGTSLISGGYQLTDPPGATRDDTNLQNVPDSYPLDTSSWYGNTGISNPTAGVPFYVYANCLQTSYAVKTTVISQFVQAGSPITITCPNGWMVTGGGWRAAPNSVDSAKATGSSWRIANPQYAYAICANLTAFAGSAPTVTGAIVPAVTQVTVPLQVSCPAGQSIIGGGFVSAGPYRTLILNKFTAASDFSSWQISVLNIDSGHTYNASVLGICLHMRPS